MCGICGILMFDGTDVKKNDIKEMCELIAHRGPDAEGIHINRNIGLGHRRLSIIDLSSSANQPMISQNKRYVVVYNGEIYNYKALSLDLKNNGIKLKTNSDTEVLLELFNLYKLESINKLRGMFAIAIWDSIERKIYLIRDRVGIKPLYYTITNNCIIFSSEIKAILSAESVPRVINIDSFWKYCRNFTVPVPDTIIKGIHKLEPGTILICDDNSRNNFIKYWDIKDCYNIKKDDFESNTIAETESVLEESVRMHTVSDVPIGSYLSGGLDSSLITHYLSKYVDNLKTYSMSFKEYPGYDESEYAYYVSNLLETKHKRIEFSRDLFTENFEKIIWHCDEPFAIASSFGVYILSKFASENLKVVMTGDGADELYGGYGGFIAKDIFKHGYISQLIINNLERLFSIGIKSFEKNNIMKGIYSKINKRSGSRSKKLTDYQSYTSNESFIKVIKRDLFGQMVSSWDKRLYSSYYENCENLDEISKRMYAEIKTRLVDEMLTKTDRMTMAHSLEARVPFLDIKVIENSCSLPTNYKIRYEKETITQKYVLKKISEKYFSNDFIYRKKSGFDVPYSNWLRDEETGTKFKEAIMDGELIRNNIIDSNLTYQIITKRENRDYGFIFSLGIFELWQKIYCSKFGKFSFN